MTHSSDPLPLPGGFQDRRTALLVVGILEIVLGAGAWLMSVLMVFGAMLGSRAGGASMATMIPGVAVYVLGGLAFVILGVGSIRARRWARSLWLVVATSWLLMGILGTGMSLIILPAAMSASGPGGNPPPPGVITVMMVVMTGFLAVFMILIPIAVLLFYRSPHVRATCEAANPEPCWTDRCPLPVLGAALWLGMMAFSLPAMGPGYGGLFPAFGRFIGGVPGYGLWIVSGLLCGVAAYGVYRRQLAFWWLALLIVIALGASAAVTYAVADLHPLFEGMGLRGAQLEQMERMKLMSPGYLVGTTLSALLPLIGLLFWARSVMGHPADPESDLPR